MITRSITKRTRTKIEKEKSTSPIAHALHSVDFFQRDMPQLNLRGKTTVATSFGGIISLLMFSIMILYAFIKFERLISRSNPNVSTYLEQSVLTSQDSVTLKDVGVRFAFAIEGYND